MVIHDEITRVTDAKEEGIKEGMKEGIMQGKIGIAQNLIKMGLSMEQIKAATGLSDEELKYVFNQ